MQLLPILQMSLAIVSLTMVILGSTYFKGWLKRYAAYISQK